MGSFVWDKRLETGIEAIDAQHRELFKRFDALELAIYESRTRATTELVMMIEYLDRYVKEHFDLEEDLMMKAHYPDFSRHRAEHGKFRLLFEGFKKEYKEKGADFYLTLDVDRELRKWWERHVLEMDMAYVPFLKGV